MVDRSKLVTPEVVLRKYSDLAGKEGKVGTMALVLACECYFGEHVMAMCTACVGATSPDCLCRN